MQSIDLPTLAYLADVPVENSYHGSALLYRLLQGYPREKLCIVEPSPWRSRPDRRLEGIDYRPFPIGWGRLLNSRFARVYGSLVLQRAPARAQRLDKVLEGFSPAAVLTVAHGYSWLTAAEYARSKNLPLHLILHDDWLTSVVALKTVQKKASQMFARYYTYAASRLCVSPGMAKRYQDFYGVSGEVLYPIRAHDSPVAIEPVTRVRTNGFVVGYAGTVNGEGYVRLLCSMASALREIGGTLLIYGPLTKERARQIGLDADNIIVRGLVSSERLIVRLREEADILFVPMSFSATDRVNMELSFPSKLTDYTAVGLPLLINGPPYCSAIAWGKQNPRSAILVDKNDERVVADTVRSLAQQPNWRRELGAGALAAGERCFSFQILSRQFEDALRHTTKD